MVAVEEEGNRTARCCYTSDEAVLEEAEDEVEMQKPSVGAGWSYHLHKDWMQESSASQVCLSYHMDLGSALGIDWEEGRVVQGVA
jgi:hypothetical protein